MYVGKKTKHSNIFVAISFVCGTKIFSNILCLCVLELLVIIMLRFPALGLNHIKYCLKLSKHHEGGIVDVFQLVGSFFLHSFINLNYDL